MASLPSGGVSILGNRQLLSAYATVRPLILRHRATGKGGWSKSVGAGIRSRNNRRRKEGMRCRVSSNSSGADNEPSTEQETKTPFGYSRKDVLLIGVGVTAIGVGLKSGLEYAGVDPLKAGNAVQLIMVLGLTVGWISTYIFRVSNKEMTYAQQLRDYEDKVIQKRLESLSEAEIEALLEQVDEEKRLSESGGGNQS
ncbi:PREDICTED: uncharacterized protein LOC104821829 [Tarenaya hassleriana]|uniref:uncharacterized protein LOC104821829 n=1 Tax=Tarenaya hassleriana TaxID=28532 RepID=UPI00053C61D8|nr:PREDICTED: uncharacterized protein LOC104821829 [Tarenaya hassleriana]